ncbi:GNAT family N-acetyltransferase [Kosakonia quasisacchari]|uniref:GNAT family N-acetyltransferase n=2 Tax=Kosakonia quasisacchari TaxID=2529380 RepID=A0A4R0HHX4_9ENTR|nr:GNAT family N-acetyltransferase [Kosakonia quasisacchari]
MQTLQVKQVSCVNEDLAISLSTLLSELSAKSPCLTAETINTILHSDAIQVFVASADERPAGMLTLISVTLLSGKKCIIEDVIVSQEFRRKGIAAELIHAAIAYAKNNGARYVDLTSRPERLAANELYQKMGFMQRTTNVYRFTL